MSKSLLFDLKVLEFKLKESLEQYEKEKIEENLELLKSSIDELCSFIVKKENHLAFSRPKKIKIFGFMLHPFEIFLLKYLVLLKKKKLEKY